MTFVVRFQAFNCGTTPSNPRIELKGKKAAHAFYGQNKIKDFEEFVTKRSH
jgi:hypothetical protein